jgi:hypothetical protein
MTALTMDLSIVDGSNTTFWPNPILPIQTPVNIPELAPVALSVPVDISELAPVALSVPVDISELAPVALSVPVDISELAPVDIVAPVNIAEVSAGNLSIPSTIAAQALDPETPPFSLKHARILYINDLLGSTIATSAGTNGNLVLVPNTADRWAITAGGVITFTLPVAVGIDSVAIGAHNLGSTGHVVSVEYSTSTTGTFSTFKTAQTPADDTAMMFHNAVSLSVRRLKITCTGSGSAFVGSIYAGVSLQMQRPFFSGHSPLPLSAKTVRYSSMTEGGNFVGEQIRRLGFRSSAPFKNITNDWYRTYFQPFVIHARTLPFFFAWNLEQYPTDVGYCKTNEDITPTYGSLDMFNVSFNMVGFG